MNSWNGDRQANQRSTAVFSILQYYVLTAMSSFTLTSAALFLPLSSLWASASFSSRSRPSKAQFRGQEISESQESRSTMPMLEYHKLQDPLSRTDSLASRMTSGVPSPHYELRHESNGDLEAQGLAGTGASIRRELE